MRALIAPIVLLAGLGCEPVVVELYDASSADSGASKDSGAPRDAESVDSGAPDSGAPDLGAPDLGAPDSGPPDSGSSCACRALCRSDLDCTVVNRTSTCVGGICGGGVDPCHADIDCPTDGLGWRCFAAPDSMNACM